MKTLLKRATVYFRPEIHRALRVKAAQTDRSISELVQEAVRILLADDAADLDSFEQRAGEQELALEEVRSDLKRRGLL